MKYDKNGIIVYDNTHKRGEEKSTIKHVLPGSQTKNYHSRKKKVYLSRKVIYLFIYSTTYVYFPNWPLILILTNY